MKSRFKPAKNWLVFWTLFIGIGAMGGGICMLIDPSGAIMGMDALLPYFKVLPFADVLFKDYVFSGIALITVNGISNLIAATLILRKKRIGVILGFIFGITLMLWICIQFYMFPLNFMSTIYFFFGLAQAITGYAAWVFARQEAFTADEKQYDNVGTNPKNLVVYFSRMGYVKKLAYEKANETGAHILEIKAKERTEGTLGFWWCGRFGMHGWEMPIEDFDVDLTSYDHVTICSAIWVFSLAAPMKAFCNMAKGKVKEADYILVHHTPGRYQGVAGWMDETLGLEGSPLRSVQCQKGKYKER